jgi:AraC-like DNA-binding protein
MLNGWAIILLLAAGQGILLGIMLVISGGKRDRSNPFLGLIILIISLELLNAWGMQVHYHNSKRVIPFWLLESYFILPASLWFFVKANNTSGFRFRRKYLLLYIPAFIEIVAETTNFIRYRMTGRSIRLLDIKAWFFSTEVLPILWMLIGLIYYAKNLPRFSKPDKAGKTVSSRIFTIKMYGLFIVFLLLTSCWSLEVVLHLPIFTIIEIILVLFLFALAYIGYARPTIFDKTKSIVKKSTGDQFFSKYDDEKESARMIRLLEQSALYTRPGLTIEEFSGELNLPVRYVSYLINSRFSTNFHHFINTYRVKEVIRKVNDPSEKHKKLIAIAFECGFNSKSSFNYVFKSHIGQSPSQFLNKK